MDIRSHPALTDLLCALPGPLGPLVLGQHPLAVALPHPVPPGVQAVDLPALPTALPAALPLPRALAAREEEGEEGN